jgi:type II secretory ATPase GspE/PulE/Tfp pilus assembly ATPase PilB-like protein
MIDMNVEPYLLSSALIGIVAQRLVRTICPTCKTRHAAGPEIINKYGWNNDKQIHLARGRGCNECYDSGYKGRMGIHEILDADEELQQLITTNPNRDELSAYLSSKNFSNLFHDGLEHVRGGTTTIEEISRVINI